ncbi:MAG: hypothetical protein ACJAW3_000068 [Lentimonas sp.]|jgi:hypothetical protein
MTKSLELIFILLFSACTFFLGVNYSGKVKESVGWMFENDGSEVELPDLADTSNPEIKSRTSSRISSGEINPK